MRMQVTRYKDTALMIHVTKYNVTFLRIQVIIYKDTSLMILVTSLHA